MTQFDLGFARDEARSFRHLYLCLNGLDELLVEGDPGHVRRQVSGILDGQLDPPYAGGELLDLEPGLQARGGRSVGEGEVRQLLALGLEKPGRRVLAGELGLPAPDLHAPELGMLEGCPGNEPFAAELPVVPGEHLELSLL